MTDEELKEKSRQERNAYFREYRRKHPEQTRRIRERYWEKRALKREGDENEKETV